MVEASSGTTSHTAQRTKPAAGRWPGGRTGCGTRRFFVGLSSGLSWVACAAGTPAVLISGFTYSSNEFQTPYQVINWHARNLL
jgi:hypothetical protein